eukprot:6948-Heterococcus_DN1.PRE.8
MKFRGVQQPNTPASMREQLQRYWPEEEVLERLLQEVLEEARLDFFAVITEVLMSTLWSQIVWKFKDLDKISVRMCMSRTSLCSSDAFLTTQSSSVSPFTVLPLFIGVDTSGQMLLQGRDGAVHYIVNNFYMHLIETTVHISFSTAQGIRWNKVLSEELTHAPHSTNRGKRNCTLDALSPHIAYINKTACCDQI